MFISACSGSAGNTSWPGLTTDQSTAYLAYGPQIYAINLDGGAQKWVYPEKIDNAITFYAAPALTLDGQLIAGSYNHKLYSLDASTGTEKWQFDKAADLFVASPLTTKDAIYAPNSDGKLYALDLTGNLLWSFTTKHQLWGTPAYAESCDCIFLPAMDHHLYAINAKTGQQIWQSADLGGAVVARPVIGSDGTLFIGTFKGEMLAFDIQSKEIRWRFQAGGWIFSAAALDGENLIFGDMKGNLYKLKANDGSQVWTKVVGDSNTSNAIASTPYVQEGNIYVSTETETVYAFNSSGTQTWMRTLAAKVYAPLVSSGSNLLVALNKTDAPLQALSSSGADVWTFSVKK